VIKLGISETMDPVLNHGMSAENAQRLEIMPSEPKLVKEQAMKHDFTLPDRSYLFLLVCGFKISTGAALFTFLFFCAFFWGLARFRRVACTWNETG
jgi:hypothetical protein